MQIVTMTTDFGLQDYFMGAMKGMMLRQCQSLNIIDISNSIKIHDVVQAAFTLKGAWHFFPKGTIHYISINNFQYRRKHLLLIEKNGHFFIAPDNGILTFALELPPQYPARRLHLSDYSLPHVGTLVGNTIAQIIEQKGVENIGEIYQNYISSSYFQPVTYINEIRGIIIHIDNYDNAVSNITRKLFDEIGRGRRFKLYYKRFDPITHISKFYNDVPIGEPLCLFNSDYLEISVNMGRAAELLGLKVKDSIQIEFEPM